MFINTKGLSALCDLNDPLQANVVKNILLGNEAGMEGARRFYFSQIIQDERGDYRSWNLDHYCHFSLASPFALFIIYLE